VHHGERQPSFLVLPVCPSQQSGIDSRLM
jgi:hypothetical protein